MELQNVFQRAHWGRAISATAFLALSYFSVEALLESIADNQLQKSIAFKAEDSQYALVSGDSIVQTSLTNASEVRFTFQQTSNGVAFSVRGTDETPYIVDENTHRDILHQACGTALNITNMNQISLDGFWGQVAHKTKDSHLESLLEDTQKMALSFQDKFCNDEFLLKR